MMTDATLARYVLGDLPENEIDALDQRSIADAEFADRVRAAEHDLADAYARGDLSPQDRLKWERGPGASPEGREQLRLARALLARERRERIEAPRARAPRYLGLAAAAIVALTIGGMYALRRAPAPDVPPTAAQATPNPQPPAAPATTPEPSVPTFVALTLAAPTRSVTEPPVLAIAPATREARITLRLEPADFTRYSVALRDLESKRILWRAGGLVPDASAEGRTLLVTVPADELSAGRLALEVSGMSKRGSELVGSYTLGVERTK
jgi:hypothetical protein